MPAGTVIDPRMLSTRPSIARFILFEGLNEYFRATSDTGVGKAVDNAAEFLLGHHLFKSTKTGGIINPEWVKLHYPLYWHYDILQALRVLGLAGMLGDPRIAWKSSLR